MPAGSGHVRGPGSGTQPPVDRLVADAWSRYQQGDMVTAEALCHEVIARSPRHPHALHLQGLLMQRAD